MLLLDVNVLVHAFREDASHHGVCRRFLDGLLGGESPFAVSELVLSGFLRVVTHPQVFRPPTPRELAIRFAEQLRQHPLCRLVAPGERHWEIFVRLCRQAGATGNLIPDAYHAALAMEMGCEWVTMDRGFARYAGLRWCAPDDG
jgi:toxin-antitoxin system PIN domain toxin